MVPFLLLGEGSIVTYHDQLDGELLNYILAARYLFTDIRIYPEIMNGLPAAGAVPPAPSFVLLYVLFEPFTAFMIAQWILYIVAFLGMYFLLLKLTGREFISFGISVIFMLLPFYPVYGLCIPGQPMLLYAVLSLFQGEVSGRIFSRRKVILYFLLIIFYGVSSSLVLGGFACLFVLGLWAAFKTINALCSKQRIPLSLCLSLGVLLISYIVTNLGLIKQVLFPASTYVSHKTELVVSAQEPLQHFKEVLGIGVSYAQSYHSVLFFLIALCFIIALFRFGRNTGMHALHSALTSNNGGLVSRTGLIPENDKHTLYSNFVPDNAKRTSHTYLMLEKSDDVSRYLLYAAKTLLFILVICLFSAFYNSSFITDIRNASDSVLKTFNLDRVCWLLPTAWCILAGYLLSYISVSGYDASSVPSDTVSSVSNAPALPVFSNAVLSAPENTSFSFRALLSRSVILAVLGVWGITVLLNCPLRPNLSKLLKGGDYYTLDWNSFFAEDIFSQIKAEIDKPQESYRVVSVGIYPAAAAYNGFYCLDGYSNNYPLAYKHTFRRIIEDELAKNDYVRSLFDNWGNRCYITTAEQANYYTFEKKWGSVIYDLDLNTDMLKEMDCQYVFSAAYLMNAEEKGLSLLREAPFETENSWYHIYVYVVE